MLREKVCDTPVVYIHRETNSIGGIKLNSEDKFTFMFFDTKRRKCRSCESAGRKFGLSRFDSVFIDAL